MRSVRPLVWLAAAVAFFAIGTFPAEAQRSHREHGPKSMLLRSMTRARRTVVSAVMTQRIFHSKGLELELKVEQDGAGRVKLTTQYPLYLQGMVSLDDGLWWKTYFPKDRRIVVQPSPRIEQGNPFYQLALADQNYTFSKEQASSIADCPTVCIVAAPKSKEMCRRRYYLDARTSFMLRLEIVTPDGDKSIPVDTRAIAYPSSPPKMDLGDDGTATVFTQNAPQKVSQPSLARDQVGFAPITPDQLPFGFIIRETQYVGGRLDKFIAVRITDGLVYATVYQWDGRKRTKHWPYDMKANYREHSGVRVSVLGDLPERARSMILAAFCK